MDRKHNFIEDFKKFIGSCDENYLIHVANKGLYKRALKDIDKGVTIEVEIKEDHVSCKLSDETTCKLTENITKYDCSCPARNVCKHLLISILYIKNNRTDLFGDDDFAYEEIQEEKDFSWILDYDIKDLMKKISNKEFEDILFRLEFGIEVDIKEEAFLIIHFKDSNVTVRFTEEHSFDQSICSCKTKGICIHRAEAMIHYKLYKKDLRIDEINNNINLKVSKNTLKEVRNLIDEITVLGLARLPENILNRIETIAVLCHSKDLPRLEKNLRSLKTKLELYFKKHASFSKKDVRGLLTRIYNTTYAIEKSKSKLLKKALIGEHRTNYRDIPPIIIKGLGAGAWKASSGYEGITYYFFNEERNIFMTYTDMKPNFYEGKNTNIVAMYKQKCSWDMDTTMESLSKMECKLFKCKINKNYRISSSEDTKGDLIDKTNINKIDFKDKGYDNWNILTKNMDKNFSYSLSKNQENVNIVILKVDTWGKCDFDQVKQVFTMPLYDKAKNCICIRLKYDHQNRKVINYIEQFNKKADRILGKIYKFEGAYFIDPITLYDQDESIFNLTLD